MKNPSASTFMDTNGRKLDTLARLARQMLRVVGDENSPEKSGQLLGPPCRKCHERKPGRYKREMCRACYQEADRLIRDGKTSWQELEAFGIAGPATKGGRPSKAASGKGLLKLLESMREKEPRVVGLLAQAKDEVKPDAVNGGQNRGH